MQNIDTLQTLRKARCHALAAAAALACAAPLAQADPATAHWTMDIYGTLGGYSSYAYALNDLGQMVGGSGTADEMVQPAALFSNGTVTDLGTLGGSFGYAHGINNAGQVAGTAYRTGNASFAPFLYMGGAMLDLGTLGGTYGTGEGINAAGQVTGGALTAAGYRHAYLYGSTGMVDLGTLGGTDSVGLAINALGQVAGYASLASEVSHAAWYDGQVLHDLGTLGGRQSGANDLNNAGLVTGWSHTGTAGAGHAILARPGWMADLGTLGGTWSEGRGVNDAGLAVGWSDLAGDTAQAGFLYSQGRMQEISSFAGIAGSGRRVLAADGINKYGQIAATVNHTSGSGTRAALLTLDTNVWQGGNSGGWDSTDGWAYGIAPNRLANVIIDPTSDITVSGPQGHVEVKRLTVGGDLYGYGGGGGGTATLRLNGGTISALGDEGGWQGVWIGRNGVLTGSGVLSVESGPIGAVFNFGTVVADDLHVQGSNLTNGNLENHGLIVGGTQGPARIVSNYLANNTDGHIRVLQGERLTIEAAMGNFGQMEVRGGQFTHIGGGPLILNSAANTPGRLMAQDALLTFASGLDVRGGQLALAAGNNTVFGAVVAQHSMHDSRYGQIILSGNSLTTFNGPVEMLAGSELQVESGSAAVFLGPVSQRSGALFTGTGHKAYEGGLDIGNSPGIGHDEGDVDFGLGNLYTAEIGGTAAGSGHDQYIVDGHLGFGGTLRLVSWSGYTGQAGQRYDLFDWGTSSGVFDFIDTTGLLLTAGTSLDLSRLYVDGTVGVAVVPEPATWALWLVGVAALGGRASRAHSPR